MTKLSVNINKIATLRNARGGNVPDLLKVATDIQNFGAHGITIHPRPDERHIRYKDARDLKNTVKTEFNIEILGKDTKVKAQTYHAYESAFIKYYEQNYNEKPILCCNSDPDY